MCDSFPEIHWAVSVLAHPFLNLDAVRLRTFLEQGRENGLDGMETYYPLFDPDTTRLACDIAEEFGLLPSGGSDFHGTNKPDIRMGTGRGDLFVPCELRDALAARAKDCPV